MVDFYNLPSTTDNVPELELVSGKADTEPNSCRSLGHQPYLLITLAINAWNKFNIWVL